MAITRSEAILLRSREFRETSLVLTFYTKDFGKIEGIAKGVRGPRAQSGGGALEPFAHDEIVFYERKRGGLFLISQCDLTEFFPAIRSDLEKLSYAAYIVELLDSLTPLGDANKKAYELTLESLKELASGNSSCRRVTRIFEIRLLDLLGILPLVNACAVCGTEKLDNAKFSLKFGGLVCKDCFDGDKADGAAVSVLAGTLNFIKHVGSSDLDKVWRIRVSDKVGEELERFLRRFLDYHIERRLKSLDFLRAICHRDHSTS